MMQAYMFSTLKGIITSFDRRGIQFTEETQFSSSILCQNTVRHVALKKNGLHRKRFLEKGYPLFLLVYMSEMGGGSFPNIVHY